MNEKKNIFQAIVTLLTIVVAVFVAINQTLPPPALPASSPAIQFSAERAIEHIKMIAQAPRLVGGPGFEAARAYVLGELIELGLNPETQQTRITIPEDLRLELGSEIPPTMDVNNIFARIQGSESQDAVLLLAHLDSRGGTGASDNASSVAVLLETARALLVGPPLRNTVIFLFTAPEEYGAHSAVAFIREHPWIKDVKLAINLDAGGLNGPSELTNISPENGWLVRALAAADPYAFGNSGFGMGKSEFTPFKFYGYSGYAFDFSRDFRVHTSLDNIENLNSPSIQHQGYHALYLTRYFGNLAPLQDPKEPDLIFFSVLRGMLVYYPTTWVIPILLFVFLVFGGVVALGFRRKCLTVSGIGLGALVYLVCLITVPLVVSLLWALVSRIIPKFTVTYNGHLGDAPLLLAIFASVTIALIALWYVLIQKIRRVSWTDLTIGALLLVFVAAIVITITSPESSHQLIWPLLFSLLAVGLWFYTIKEDSQSLSAVQFFGLLAAAVLSIVLIVPNLYMSFTGAETNQLVEPIILLVLLAGLLIPQLLIMIRPQKWWLPAAAVLMAVVLSGFALFV